MPMPPDDLIPVEEHLSRILGGVDRLAPVELPIMDAIGLTLVDDVIATAPLPGFDNSGMDGYAVVADDLAGASRQTPVTLPVIGDIAAGSAAVTSIHPGQTARIMTGAPVPLGCTAVVPVEWTDQGTAEVQIFEAPRLGQHIRCAGEDVRPGDLLVCAGTTIGPREIAAIVSGGWGQVRVVRRPKVAVLSTGLELRQPGEPLGPDSLYDSNSFMLAAQVEALGGVADRVVVATDDPKAFALALAPHLSSADAIVTSGGVSKGAFDVVKEVLRERVRFDTVAMQPGKPQGFGLLGERRVPIFTLPGNPVSSYISFEVFVLPALRKMMGRSLLSRPLHEATLTESVRSVVGKRQFLRGKYDGGSVDPAGGPGSHLVAGLAGANALIVLDEECASAEVGDRVPVLVLDENF